MSRLYLFRHIHEGSPPGPETRVKAKGTVMSDDLLLFSVV